MTGDKGFTITNPPPRYCEIHGEVFEFWIGYGATDPLYSTPKLCPKCYVDWVTVNVRSTQEVK